MWPLLFPAEGHQIRLPVPHILHFYVDFNYLASCPVLHIDFYFLLLCYVKLTLHKPQISHIDSTSPHYLITTFVMY